jgi:hypothetical protein
MIVTVEAKKRRQRILPEQIVRQVKAAFTETPVDVVVPLALISAGGKFTLRSSHQSCGRDQVAGLSQALKAPRVMADHNLLNHPLDDLHDRPRQRRRQLARSLH